MDGWEKNYIIEVLEIEIAKQNKAKGDLSLVPNAFENQGVGKQFEEIAERVRVLKEAINNIKEI